MEGNGVHWHYPLPIRRLLHGCDLNALGCVPAADTDRSWHSGPGVVLSQFFLRMMLSIYVTPGVLLDERAEAGRGGKGEVAVAKSSVATWPVLPAGAPQAEQKRPVEGTSVPQDEQVGMNFSRYSLPRKIPPLARALSADRQAPAGRDAKRA
jgi:hypothetical protein